MIKYNPTRYTSAVGEVWVMATFKVKYCHKVFRFERVRKVAELLFMNAMDMNNIRYRKISFDEDHVHILLDMGLFSKPEIAKRLKGYVAKKLFASFPWLKKRYFWGSGFWNPAYDIRSHDVGVISRYLDKQKYAHAGQRMVTAF